MLLNCGVREDSWESLRLQGDPASLSYRKSLLNINWKDWYWSWNSNTLATWWEELTQRKRPWCWERLKAGEGDNRGWDGWMASPTQWTWIWVNSRSWWWAGRPGVLQSMRLQRVRHDWATELNWSVSIIVWFYFLLKCPFDIFVNLVTSILLTFSFFSSLFSISTSNSYLFPLEQFIILLFLIFLLVLLIWKCYFKHRWF